MRKLYEVEHPFYMNEGCYFSNECHNEYSSFDSFLEEWGDADMDYNWIIRWDWVLDSTGNDLLKIQFFIQRKSYPISCDIRVTKSDHKRVVEFLKPYAEYMKRMWEPFTLNEELGE